MWGDFIDNENNMFFCLKFLVLTHILYNSHRRDSTDEHLQTILSMKKILKEINVNIKTTTLIFPHFRNSVPMYNIIWSKICN